MLPDRRRLLAAIATTGLTAPLILRGAAAQGTAQGLAKTRLQLGWIPNVQYAGEWVALEKGLFRKHGVELEWAPGGPNAPAAPVVLAAGRADLGYTSWFPFLDAVTRGNDFVMVGVVFPKSPLGIVSLAKKPIRRPQDLVGARILAQGAPEKTAIDATLAIAGLPVQWTQVPAGFSPEPLLSGQGDGYTAFSTNQVITLENMGLVRDKDFFFASFDELGFRTYGSVLAAPRAYVERNRPAVVGYLRGLIGGMQENERDPSLAPRLAVQRYGVDFGLDLKQQTRQNALQIPLTHYDEPGRPLLSLDRALMAGVMYDGARAAGRTNLPDVDRIADFSLVAEAHQGL
ncbi:ABC transporter substrate-binding protein [Muricoccus pecuniae]|uniref:Thiamine pyrimidine synthase n=1 Tax=Muricoccus pecuniae TaxID=693023 RepID=A0A840YCL5_9PROT|nr:ABC transporter substrate-binding protein [Roseomonas pecuniae]MBB5694097.1 ABC-type nitrate/sulfonate/bicarbonate transport system substrate-binding protein [Roseomonas pecuniae]